MGAYLVPLLLAAATVASHAAAPAGWSYHELAGTGPTAPLCLVGDRGAFDFLPAVAPAPPPTVLPPAARCQLALSASPAHAHFSWFIKTGGDPTVASGFHQPADRC
jgi:hypothetical protein